MMQKHDYIVISADLIDAHDIAVLEKEYFSQPWSYEQIYDEIIKPNCIFLSAKSSDKVIGYVSGQMILDEFYISNIAVSNEFRNQGVASALLTELISAVKKLKASFITLEVRESNIPAKKLYEKFGFENLGVRKNFYSHPTENANIYTIYFNNEVN